MQGTGLGRALDAEPRVKVEVKEETWVEGGVPVGTEGCVCVRVHLEPGAWLYTVVGSSLSHENKLRVQEIASASRRSHLTPGEVVNLIWAHVAGGPAVADGKIFLDCTSDDKRMIVQLQGCRH
ncbi:hypothetical protein BaRGS_00035962 [Batillaria attramentaria]|uniref:Uncharacterized protein n=1 Tax=Batillaria attramentaria TaxID=370345 RepID=A0ABD0JCS1_9CAEN